MIIKRKSILRRIFSFKLFFLVGICTSFVFGPALGGEFYRNYQIEKEIGSLKSEIESVEKNNYELSKLVEYYKTEEYKEVEARKRLGVKAEGESVAIIKQGIQSEKVEKGGVEIINNDNYPNYMKWWNYFFEKKEKLEIKNYLPVGRQGN